MALLLSSPDHLRALLGVVDAAFRDDTPIHNAGKSDLWLQVEEPSSTFVIATSVFDERGLLVTTRPRDSERHALGAEWVDLLYDSVSGKLDALIARDTMDSTNIALVSTAGCLAMAPSSVTSLAMLGSGIEACCHLPVLFAAMPTIMDIRIYSPNEDRRARYTAEMSTALGITATAVDGADVIAGMTSASAPVFEVG